jgi:hypothetical protein
MSNRDKRKRNGREKRRGDTRKPEREAKEMSGGPGGEGNHQEATFPMKDPIGVIEKPNGDMKLVRNLVALNDLAIKDTCRIPEMKRIVEVSVGAKFMMVMDLRERYYHVEMEEKYKRRGLLNLGMKRINGTEW